MLTVGSDYSGVRKVRVPTGPRDPDAAEAVAPRTAADDDCIP